MGMSDVPSKKEAYGKWKTDLLDLAVHKPAIGLSLPVRQTKCKVKGCNKMKFSMDFKQALKIATKVLYPSQLCFTVLYRSQLCFTVLYLSQLCFTVLYFSQLCFTVAYCALLCFTVAYCALLCFTVLYCALL